MSMMYGHEMRKALHQKSCSIAILCCSHWKCDRGWWRSNCVVAIGELWTAAIHGRLTRKRNSCHAMSLRLKLVQCWDLLSVDLLY